ncbi:unnamed protein product [Paramecium primaurelia]|uniref:Uncharacterized protein n=1 Tax=Paramecium primaurelia TaxID=5886 RepID=A0A8S1MSX4_PARPR|nr:unnamed protein product [Paramecium primaurelia]
MYTEEIKSTKIALFGNTFVGKTHLFTKFDWERLPKVIHSNILTVGQERYKQISFHIKKGQGIYLVYGQYRKGDLQQFKSLVK